MSTGTSAPAARGPRWSRHLGRVIAHVPWRTEVLDAGLVPRTGPVIVAANHIGLLDGPIVHGVIPRPSHVLVKEEMFTGPVGVLLRGAGQIPVDRRNGRPALTAALGVLRRGDVVGIFPEGMRGRGDASDSRAGVAWLAVTSGAPVVPCAVLGTRRTGESTSSLPPLRRRLVVGFGAPVRLDAAPGSGRREAVTRANEVLRVALSEHVQRVSRLTGVELPDD